ncbi:GAF domain-containing sensor histidine kinase [Paenibacillus roseipurpureus]|uniref:histidine kinase n=1 Tax=Paenibacillus roseopurpureus TaxID=2918901 RepID=A0AA96RK67_9BACL|nr:ATP-binding protein [Paenibacillus sp. MBLB1832]WNR44029.1 histidine kinase [Paenibacillus sp. MBLB1832]
MNVEVNKASSLDAVNERLVPWSMRIAQLVVLSFCLLTAVLYISAIPAYYKVLVESCITQGCSNLFPAMPLPANGLSLEQFALIFVLIDVSFTFFFYITSAIVLWKGFREPMGLVAAVAMVSFGSSFPSLVMAASEGTVFTHQWFMIVSTLSWVSMSLFLLLFPNGKFVPKWTRYVFALTVIVNVMSLVYSGQMWEAFHIPEIFKFLWYVSSTLILIYSQVYRFRNVASAAERQQTKWVVYGATIGIAGFVGMSALFVSSMNDGTVLTFVYLNALINASLTAIPITLMFAVLRQRLWNIDPLVNRTLVYGSLSVCIVLIYTVIVFYLSRVFQTRDHYVVSLLATAVVAVVFAPLKEWLQRQINRLMKGRHDDPYAVLLELGNQLIQPQAPDAMLNAVVRTVKEALRLPYTAIYAGVGGQQTLVASAGSQLHEQHVMPIIHRGVELGTLHIASRSAGEVFTADDNKFLDVLLRQAGPIVENWHMTQGMKLLAQDLQESREKLVLAREEERLQIRKNLHDDLAPKLAALALNAATAQIYVEKQPDVAIEMLADLRKVIRSTVDEIRTLVHDLRPPTLDELGLLGAIQERIALLSKPAAMLAGEKGAEALDIRMHAPQPLPSLPAAVEVAVYRIVTESLVNVVKHAKATTCTVRLEMNEARQLQVEIRDNGAQFAPLSINQAAGSKSGIGLVSMRERAAELGGHCHIDRPAGGGTRVLAVIPLP